MQYPESIVKYTVRDCNYAPYVKATFHATPTPLFSFHSTTLSPRQSNHSAEFYLDHEKTKDLLSHRQLLQDYGAEEDLADSMLSDQGRSRRGRAFNLSMSSVRILNH